MKVHRDGHLQRLGASTIKIAGTVAGVAVFLSLSGILLNWTINWMKARSGSRPRQQMAVLNKPLVDALKKETVQTDHGPVELYIKRFELDRGALQGYPWLIPPLTPSTNVAAQLREIIGRAGVELVPPKSLFFEAGSHQVWIRASMSDLAIFESITRFLELRWDDKLRGNTNCLFYPTAAQKTAFDDSEGKLIVKQFSLDFARAVKTFQLADEGFAKTGPKVCAELFSKSGVKMNAPGRMACLRESGTLLVRASQQEIDSIKTWVDVVGYTPQLVALETKFVEVDGSPERFLEALGITLTNISNSFITSNNMIVRQAAAVLNPSQYNRLCQELDQAGACNVIVLPKIKVMNGNSISVQGAEQVRVKDKKGRTQTIKAPPFMSYFATVNGDLHTIKVAALLSANLVISDNQEQNSMGKLLAYYGPVEDGHTLILVGYPSDKEKGRPLIGFITSSLVDNSGNLLHPN